MMAAGKNVSNLGGYHYEFTSKVPDGLECPVCLFTLKDPVQIGGCGHRVCNICLEALLGCRSPKCPVDRQPLSRDKIFPDVACRRKILDLTVKCSSVGCTWTGELRTVEKHQSECLLKVVECPNGGCTETFIKQDMEHHKAFECFWRKVNCEYCHESFILKDKQLHFGVCQKLPVQCSNSCGLRDIPREKLVVHIRDECPLTEVHCEYKNLGCKDVFPRTRAKSHSESQVERHLNLALHGLEASQYQVKDLASAVKDQSQQIERLMAIVQDQSRQIEVLNTKAKGQSEEMEAGNVNVNVQVQQQKELAIEQEKSKGKSMKEDFKPTSINDTEIGICDEIYIIENVKTLRYLFQKGPVIRENRGDERGWKASSGVEAPPVVGADDNYNNRAYWMIIPQGCDIYSIKNIKTKRYLFQNGPDVREQFGDEGECKAAIVGADSNYNNRAYWRIIPQGGGKYILENVETKRYLFQDGPQIKGQRGDEGGWKASSGFKAPPVVGADANDNDRAFWKIIPQSGGGGYFVENFKTNKNVFPDGSTVKGKLKGEKGWKTSSGFKVPAVVDADAKYCNQALETA